MKASELDSLVTARSTGRKVALPRWASFVILATRVLPAPVFIIPYVGMMAVCVLSASPVDFARFAVFAIIAAVPMLIFSTTMVAQRMRRDGVLDSYMALLLAHSATGRLVARRFGRIEGDEHVR